MLRKYECVTLVLIILIFARCTCFVENLPPNKTIADKSTLYGDCGHAITDRGMNSADEKTLIQECVDKSINKLQEKENVS